ncbi:zinc ribbon domain-containing protein [Yanshouia hominis]|uniref:Zinc ribbon domain-containing protein n=1 Tax=Yanshouia hominis TaxID=2763673 RepID=A0ABR7NF80_9FIRM|nr:zinc ribbon domain-containing protein [Yanshouia hominis]MBC8575063.1 zinc ribbon domain-containing protein [Yanshouia hominis]
MNWICPKCGSAECSTGQFQATGGNFAKFFDIQNKRFTTITCGKCRFTELYQADVSELENIFDFLLG